MLRIELNLVPSDTAQPSEVITDFAQESHTEAQLNARKPLGVWIGFGTLALSNVPVLHAVGATVGPGAVLALLLAAVFVGRQARAGVSRGTGA
jgi:hypothetical protein